MYCDCSYTNRAESILFIYDLLLIDRNYIDYKEAICVKDLRNCIMFEIFKNHDVKIYHTFYSEAMTY